MPRPAIRVTPKTEQPVEAAKKEPTGLPKLQDQPKEGNPDFIEAAKAVEWFETQKRVYDEMKADWEGNFPEANGALQDIKHQEDEVHEAIAKAKPLVSKIKTTIGGFVATRKFSKPRYDEEEVAKILHAVENKGELLEEMFQRGLITGISLDQKACLAWIAQRPAYATLFQTAFRDSEELTCAVTVPKF